MPSSTEERVAELVQKVDDLAAFVGRLMYGMVGANFAQYDPADDDLLVWHEEVDTELGKTRGHGPIGWWTYKTEGGRDA